MIRINDTERCRDARVKHAQPFLLHDFKQPCRFLIGHDELDRYDKQILAVLQQDGRISNQDLAERIGLSPSPCLRRVRALEAAGVKVGRTPSETASLVREIMESKG